MFKTTWPVEQGWLPPIWREITCLFIRDLICGSKELKFFMAQR